MTTAKTTFDTALGRFETVAECELAPESVSFAFQTVEPPPELPSGMSVERCSGVLVHVVARDAIANLQWSCVAPPGADGSPSSGEHLHAQEWDTNGRMVVVGTEDDFALADRLPFVDHDRRRAVVDCTPQRLIVTLNGIPAGASFSLHFILAENLSPEPAECSAWFAVDVPHYKLIALAAA